MIGFKGNTVDGNLYRLIPVISIGGIILGITGLRNSLLFFVGVLVGIAFVRGKLGFTSGWRRLVLYGDTGNFHRQLLFIGIGSIVFIPIFAGFDTLNKALAPIAWSGIIGAVIFGIGMQLADGCGSGILYKSGSNTRFSQTTLLFFIVGNFAASLNFHHWLNLGTLHAVDLSDFFNWYGAIILQLILLAVLFYVSKWWGKSRSINRQNKHKADFTTRAFLFVIVLALVNLLLTGQMWGIVYAFGLWGAKISLLFGADLSNVPYWNQPITLQSLEQSVLFDITTLTNLGLILGAWYATKNLDNKNPATHSKANIKSAGVLRNYSPIIGGLLLGYGSKLGFGCNIGAFFSGVVSGSLHGWLWFIFAFCGSLIGIKFRKYFGYND